MAENNEMFEQQNEYPKTIEFDVGIMKKNAAKMLGVAAGISVLMVAIISVDAALSVNSGNFLSSLWIV